MRKNDDFQEERSSRSSASSRSSSSSESSSDEEDKGNECFLEKDNFLVEKDQLPVASDQLPVENYQVMVENPDGTLSPFDYQKDSSGSLPVLLIDTKTEPEVDLTDCESLVLADIDYESDNKSKDKELHPVVLDAPQSTSGEDFILSPVLSNDESGDINQLPVLNFVPKIESEVTSEQDEMTEMQVTGDSEIINEQETSLEPEVIAEAEIECTDRTSLVLADNGSSTEGESEEESDTLEKRPVLTFVKIEPEITIEPESIIESEINIEPEVINEPEIPSAERSSLVLAENESLTDAEFEETEDLEELPVLTSIGNVEPKVCITSEAECLKEQEPFVPKIDEFNNLSLPDNEPETSFEDPEVENVDGPLSTFTESKSLTDGELTDSKPLPSDTKNDSNISDSLSETSDILEKQELSKIPEVKTLNEFIESEDSEDDSVVFENPESMNRSRSSEKLEVSVKSEVSENTEVKNADESPSSAEHGSCTIFARFLPDSNT